MQAPLRCLASPAVPRAAPAAHRQATSLIQPVGASPCCNTSSGPSTLTRSPGRLPSPSGLFWVTGSEGPPPGVRWPPASRGMRTQQRAARPTSAPGRSPPGGGTMPSAAWCARTASSATRACGPPVLWYRKSAQRPAGPAGAPVMRGRAGSAPCGQHCRRGTRVCGAARTARTGHACSRRWPPAATAGTHRHPARPRARPAAGPARGQQVPAVAGTGQPPLHPASAAGMTTATSRASSADKTTVRNGPVLRPGAG
jgi:hypothetical protein